MRGRRCKPFYSRSGCRRQRTHQRLQNATHLSTALLIHEQRVGSMVKKVQSHTFCCEPHKKTLEQVHRTIFQVKEVYVRTNFAKKTLEQVHGTIFQVKDVYVRTNFAKKHRYTGRYFSSKRYMSERTSQKKTLEEVHRTIFKVKEACVRTDFPHLNPTPFESRQARVLIRTSLGPVSMFYGMEKGVLLT